MNKSESNHSQRRLGNRARQVMDVIFKLGHASAHDILRELPDIPSYSAVRSILRRLEQKGLVRHEARDLHYIYIPTTPLDKEMKNALRHVVDTFFDSSPEKAMKALLDLSQSEIYDLDIDEIEKLIEEAKKEGR